ncbi:hypothetical protein L1887_55544 [Cichorium endivia]|nr:hypothetical protein L1887_55544 [Cichorium endivia]
MVEALGSEWASVEADPARALIPGGKTATSASSTAMQLARGQTLVGRRHPPRAPTLGRASMQAARGRLQLCHQHPMIPIPPGAAIGDIWLAHVRLRSALHAPPYLSSPQTTLLENTTNDYTTSAGQPARPLAIETLGKSETLHRPSPWFGSRIRPQPPARRSFPLLPSPTKSHGHSGASNSHTPTRHRGRQAGGLPSICRPRSKHRHSRLVVASRCPLNKICPASAGRGQRQSPSGTSVCLAVAVHTRLPTTLHCLQRPCSSALDADYRRSPVRLPSEIKPLTPIKRQDSKNPLALVVRSVLYMANNRILA